MVDLLDSAAMSTPTPARPVLDLVADDADGADGPRERITYELVIDATSLYLEGHFPGFPIFPGVAQLTAVVMPGIRHRWPDLAQPRRISRVKFRAPIVPGDRLRLHLERERGASQVRFRVDRDGRACTEGALEFPAA